MTSFERPLVVAAALLSLAGCARPESQFPNGQAALDRMSGGALIVNAKGMPLFANARAQELLERGDGLSCGPAGLRAQQPTLTQNLLDAIQAVGDRRWTGDLHLSLPRRKPRLPLLLDILSLSRLALDARGGGDRTDGGPVVAGVGEDPAGVLEDAGLRGAPLLGPGPARWSAHLLIL